MEVNYPSCKCLCMKIIFIYIFFSKAFIYPTSTGKHTQMPIFQTHTYIYTYKHTHTYYTYINMYVQTHFRHFRTFFAIIKSKHLDVSNIYACLVNTYTIKLNFARKIIKFHLEYFIFISDHENTYYLFIYLI